MAKKIVDIGRTYKPIVDVGEHYPPLDPATVAAGLGAEPLGQRQKGHGPQALFLVRQGVAEALHGSPTSAPSFNNEDRLEIHLPEKDWAHLQHLASTLAGGGAKPTAAQVAGALLKLSLSAPNLPLLRQELEEGFMDAKTVR